MHGVRQWWVRLSILHKAIVLSCAFVIPILLVVGLLMNDFYDYREKSDDILSEYARCTDYMNAMEQENALLGELTLCRTPPLRGSGCAAQRPTAARRARCLSRSSTAR